MVSILHRYIFREIFKIFVLATAALSIILSLGMILRPVQQLSVGSGQVLNLIGYMLPIPYYMQIVLFVCLVAGMLIYDRVKPSKENVRTKEYLFLVFAGVAGAVYGLVNDSN